MGSSTLDHEYAEDVTDLREAQRIIAELRRALRQSAELTYFDDGEFTIFLDDKHAEMVKTLFERRRLFARQDQQCELHDALGEFVSHWLDIQSNAQEIVPDKSREHLQYVTPSA